MVFLNRLRVFLFENLSFEFRKAHNKGNRYF